MRTTVNLDNHLLAAAKQLAARTHRSLGAVIDDALRAQFARATTGALDRGTVTLPTDGGSGLQPGVDLEDKAQLAALLGDEEPRASA